MTPGRARNARIFRLKDLPPVERGRGIKSIPLAGPETGSSVLLQGQTIFPPGGAIALHTHSSDECIVVLEGRAACEVNGERHELEPFDGTFVEAGVPHRFINVGNAVLRILWTYSAVDTTRTFVETGETAGHLDSYATR
jgi:quercetin dioxygenase-like cupin family protein